MSGWIDRGEDLEVFRRAYALSLEVHRASLDFPRIEQFAVADQIRRASKSICANIAEGFGRQRLSKPEFRRFVVMALGSADEMQVWSLYCRDLGLYRWGRGGALAGRIPGDCPDAFRPASRQFWYLTSDICLLEW
jgi:four helix bundle protein